MHVYCYGGQSQQTLHKLPVVFKLSVKFTPQFCRAGSGASGPGSALRKIAESGAQKIPADP